MSNYWYNNRFRLEVGHVCVLENGSRVKLDERVPGDGTDWYVLTWWDDGDHDPRRGWTKMGKRIHPSEIKSA